MNMRMAITMTITTTAISIASLIIRASLEGRAIRPERHLRRPQNRLVGELRQRIPHPRVEPHAVCFSAGIRAGMSSIYMSSPPASLLRIPSKEPQRRHLQNGARPSHPDRQFRSRLHLLISSLPVSSSCQGSET